MHSGYLQVASAVCRSVWQENVAICRAADLHAGRLAQLHALPVERRHYGRGGARAARNAVKIRCCVQSAAFSLGREGARSRTRAVVHLLLTRTPATSTSRHPMATDNRWLRVGPKPSKSQSYPWKRQGKSEVGQPGTTKRQKSARNTGGAASAVSKVLRKRSRVPR